MPRGDESIMSRALNSSTAGVDAVLGNHDLHLLAAAAGVQDLRSGDTLRPVLEAPDRDELLLWLSHRPLLLIESGFALNGQKVHVAEGLSADAFVVAARTSGQTGSEEGLSPDL